uniref:uncharacterized protein LOC122778812 n=1 Tax=Solea senegalensis TaxID=28829 RepID=UPI001CD87EE8|nr:uncharacterized protein LOC122778812 [Solea senegalensis]
MEGQSPLSLALQHLAAMQESTTTLQQQQSQLLADIAASQRDDRALLRELLQRPAAHGADPEPGRGRSPPVALQRMTAEDCGPGQVCWRCGQPGHIRAECPLMEVGQVVRVAGPPAPFPQFGRNVPYTVVRRRCRIPTLLGGGAQMAPMEDFPLAQSRDETLRHAFDQVMEIDGCPVHPNTALSHPYFVVVKDRLYRLQITRQWQGPFVVTRRVGDVDYEVVRSDRGGATQIYHLNLLKAWREVASVSLATTVIERDELGPEVTKLNRSAPVPVDDHLSPGQRADVALLQRQFADVFSPLPGRTNLIHHHIETSPGVTVRSRPYRLPEHKRKTVQAELQAMLEMGVIEESNSDWCCPIVLVRKSDGSIRFCVDYRRVNEVSKFDAYPMPRVDELLDRLGPARFFTTLDLTKGYWQIPLSLESREKTAFSTPYGLYQFVTLPFGLFGAPATFQRLMDRVLRPHSAYAAAYLDDVILSFLVLILLHLQAQKL